MNICVYTSFSFFIIYLFTIWNHIIISIVIVFFLRMMLLLLFGLYRCMCLYYFPFFSSSTFFHHCNHIIYTNCLFLEMILFFTFFVYIDVDGQSLNAGKETCKQIKCNKDKNLTCPCCVFKTENWYKCYKSMEECSRFCGKRS